MAIKDFLQHSAGKAVGVIFALGALGLMGWMLLVPDDAANAVSDTQNIWFIDEDGNAFRQKLEPGASVDVRGPNGKPAFVAELCYWTKEGKPKDSPTAVLLNRHVNKPEPTFCPDCRRLVLPMNPPAVREGKVLTPPPTEADYKAR